ncbi:MAG: hypothetical protein U9N56_00890 [Actinomycetota bacterium]|nr:hypothetical protein [Actinomycetota bacterium]
MPHDLEDLRQVDVDAFPIPPLLLTVVTREEQDLGPVWEHMLDLENVSLFALRTIHGTTS